MSGPRVFSFIIVGTGFGGLCMGAKLKEAGRDDFVILEKASSVGGTWRENKYPGAECDIASVLYSYSFYPNPTWDFKWAKQPQILAYLEQFAKDMDLSSHIHFGQAVEKATFDEADNLWTVHTRTGDTYRARYFIPSIGQLHDPQIPEFEGQENFNGQAFHTAQWPDSVDLAGKSVAIIGNAASAIQVIPELAEIASHLTVYQRSANWVIPKGDRPYSKIEKSIAKRLPGLARLYRGFWFAVGEYGLYPIIKGRKFHAAIARWVSLWKMKSDIKAPHLRAALTPQYPMGAKRILLSDKYYEALAKDNVSLETRPILKFDETGIETEGNAHSAFSHIIYATGFKTNPFYSALNIIGRSGTALSRHWSEGAFAYHGVLTHGFPNMFMLYGPNTNSGHTSIVFKLENQVNYILKLVERWNGKTIEVREGAEKAYDSEMQNRLKQTAWSKIDESWYKQGSRIVQNWPGSALEYRRRMKTPIWHDFEVSETA